jgi:hypothetical protein
MTNIVEERQRNRRLFLQKIYELPDTTYTDMYNVGQKLGWDREKTESISYYLCEEGLLTIFNGGNIMLTHQGVKKVEETETSPDRMTLHITNNIIHGDNVGGDKVMSDKIDTQINNSTGLTNLI